MPEIVRIGVLSYIKGLSYLDSLPPCPCSQQFLRCCFLGTTGLLEFSLPLWTLLYLICLILAPAWDHPPPPGYCEGGRSLESGMRQTWLVSYPWVVQGWNLKIYLCASISPKIKWGKQFDRGILKIKWVNNYKTLRIVLGILSAQ